VQASSWTMLMFGHCSSRSGGHFRRVRFRDDSRVGIDESRRVWKSSTSSQKSLEKVPVWGDVRY
jgi:hypothetical protein